MYADVPGYSAMIFRRTFSDLSQPDALIPRSHEWLGATPAKWSEQKHRWTFPSGATLSFGYMQHENDKYNYQGSAAQFYGWDELTQFEETQYLYMLSRLRRRTSSPVPLRVRSASNPGNVGHDWVYERFVLGDKPFVPASLLDNPHLNAKEYRENLEELDDTTRKQLLEGLWVKDPKGKPFKREHFRRNRYDLPPAVDSRIISVDTAIKAKDGSDYTACVVSELGADYRLSVREVWEERLEFPELPDAIAETAARWNADSRLWRVIIEDKGSGSSALQTLWASSPAWLSAILVPYVPRMDKVARARQAAVWCKRGCVLLPSPSEAAPWLPSFERQLFGFPEVAHDDSVDAFSQAVLYLENILSDSWRARGTPLGDGEIAGRAV